MNNSVRVLSNVFKGAGQRSTPQGGLTLVRNAGGGAQAHGPGIPFPPGPRQLQQAKNWIGSGAVFGATAFGLLCYFSDWRVVVDWIPFYSGKFPPEEPKAKK